MVIDGLLVLGALEARDRGRPLPIGAPRTRTLLALLLTPPNTLVSVDRLVDELWPEQAPPEARDLVHGYVSRLRRSLRAGSAADRLVTRRPGYLLRVEEHQLDRCRFERLLADARAGAEARRLDESLSQYRQAGQLWRAAGRAAYHWHRALRRFTQLDVPEAVAVRTHLQELTRPARPVDNR